MENTEAQLMSAESKKYRKASAIDMESENITSKLKKRLGKKLALRACTKIYAKC